MRTLLLFSTLALSAFAQPASPPAETAVAVNGKNIRITYSSPSMRGRQIFGGLVPYDKVWRAGANAATTLTTDAALMIGDLAVPAGKYTLYILPTAESWTLIVNKQTGQWGTEYSQGQDLGRVKMKVSTVGSPVERWQMLLTPPSGNKTNLQLTWEKTQATIPITVK